jgi:lysozyme
MRNFKSALFKPTKVDQRYLLIFLGGPMIAIAGICGLFYFGKIYANDPDHKRFPVRGIDISSHQQQIDWQQLDRSSINFMLIKATEGGDFKDSLFQINWQNARQQGMTVGAYHFFTFCKSGREQAQNYINSVPKLSGMLPPVIDLEFSGNCQSRPTPAELTTELNIFIAIVEKAYRKRAILYVTHEFYDQYLRDRYANQPIWLSDFYSFNKLPRLTDDQQWLFWQYSERGSIIGISTLVDLNVFNGDQVEFNRLVNTEMK